MSRVGVAFEAADLFVFPSLYEGFGIALAEAMWVGLPVVASKIPVIQELVEEGQTGLLIPPGSHESLVAALELLLDDIAVRQSLGQAGTNAARRFNPAAVAPMWHELWDSLASAPASR
jgi:glycosyltransferase involved in cell wall biosynthesis